MDIQESSAYALITKGDALMEEGKFSEAQAAFREAVFAFKDLAATNPSRFRYAIGNALESLEDVLMRSGQYREALHVSYEVLESRRELAFYRSNADTRFLYGSALQRCADLLVLLQKSEEAFCFYWGSCGLYWDVIAINGVKNYDRMAPRIEEVHGLISKLLDESCLWLTQPQKVFSNIDTQDSFQDHLDQVESIVQILEKGYSPAIESQAEAVFRSMRALVLKEAKDTEGAISDLRYKFAEALVYCAQAFCRADCFSLSTKMYMEALGLVHREVSSGFQPASLYADAMADAALMFDAFGFAEGVEQMHRDAIAAVEPFIDEHVSALQSYAIASRYLADHLNRAGRNEEASKFYQQSASSYQVLCMTYPDTFGAAYQEALSLCT